ncbi:hypothetical protein DSLPV1_138 [Dishui lake phycodnavirus 1]|uniref:hypothetical protein n=1 Tax=Dishui lake phycodnavirus 1 TaxID=2079134 RepID=UPI000CD6B5F2|nr:hypothetical protein C5Y57_gp138 [Dishui lake phycodnavirus 1]AUT19109.1 hypothetical protein DSLPV1_138 [Dishui lake phycodnavirus 1]
MENPIRFDEIHENEIVKVFCKEDDVEEDLYAVVTMNTGRVLGVRYLTATDKIYKSATCYQLEEETQGVSPESLLEHYPETTLEDLDYKMVDHDLYVRIMDIDVEDDNSEIWEDDDDESDLSFVVSDDMDEAGDLPPDHEVIDREWNSWQPSTFGSRSFKDTVDMIEARERARLSSL